MKIKFEKISLKFSPHELSEKQFFSQIDFSFSGLDPVKNVISLKNFDYAKLAFINYLKNREFPQFFFKLNERDDLIGNINEFYKDSRGKTIKRANQICAHEYDFIIANCPKFKDKVNWLSNLKDDRQWEIKYWRDIDYSSDKRIGDVRLIWELNRHQYFIHLGKAYLYTKDERYAKEFVAQLRDWIKTNPYGKSINWVHAQEVALRIISWTWAYHFFCDSPSFTVEDQIEMLKSLFLQTEFIMKHISDTKYSPTHNHIVSETAGLAMMSLMFPEFKKSKEWWKNGVNRLPRELRRQICDDGGSGEMATNYHFFVLDSFLQIAILLDINGFPYPSDLKKMLEKMIELAMHICRPDGTLPIIGDSDNGRNIKLDDFDDNDRRSYLSTGAVLFNRTDMKSISGKFYEESLWLLGTKGLKMYQNLSSTKPRNLSILYPDSGFCIMRSNWSAKASQLIFRVGAINIPKDVSIGHNHADYLSFELIIDGKPFIIDPGVYTYNLEEWRWYGRKTSTHNTVEVDETDQFVINSQRFGLPKIAKSTVHTFESTDSFDFIHASHDGYESLPNTVTHNRKIFFDKIEKCWNIIDTMVGRGRHKFIWYFHFDAEIELEMINEYLTVARSKEGSHLFLRPLQLEKLTVEIFDGWVSKRYWVKEKAKILKYSTEFTCPYELEIEFSISK